MKEKAKRHSNTRKYHYFSIFLLLSMAVIGALLALLVAVMKPTGERIVYIAPDENYVNNIWIADINNPENPQQITSIDETDNIYNLYAESGKVFYSIRNDNQHTLWFYDSNTGNHEKIIDCVYGCTSLDLHPNGYWLIYQESLEVKVIDLQTRIQTHPIDTKNNPQINGTPMPQWIGDTDQLLVGGQRKSPERENVINELVRYDMKTEALSIGESFNIEDSALVFSPNGQYFASLSILYDNTISIRNIDKPDIPLLNFESERHYQYFFYEWHPNNEQIFIIEGNLTEKRGGMILSLFHIHSGEKQVIFTSEWSSRQTRLTGGKINSKVDKLLLVMNTHSNSNDFNTIIFDLEQNKEIKLPIYGVMQQWLD